MNPGSGLLRGRRVLVVEDEVIESLMLADLLTGVGCVVIGPVGTTTAALALIKQEVIHCAVLDVKLLDGMSLPVAEALAARGIRFVLATGYNRASIPLAYDGAPVLHKVFMPEQLIDTLADILRP